MLHAEQVDDGRPAGDDILIQPSAAIGGRPAVARFQETTVLQVADAVESCKHGQSREAFAAEGVAQSTVQQLNQQEVERDKEQAAKESQHHIEQALPSVVGQRVFWRAYQLQVTGIHFQILQL